MYILLILPFFVVLYVCNLLVSIVLLFIPRYFRRRKDIKGQIVLITGGGSGIGRELAIQFSKHSTCLVLLDIDMPSLLETEKLLGKESKAFSYVCDVSKPSMVNEVAERVRKEAGDVDILVNNAGIVSGKRLLELSEERIVKTMEVNALAHFWMCRAFLPAMMEKNRGHIVSIVSIAGKLGGPKVTDYCASKFAALGFAESLEMELREQKKNGIKVTAVCPTVINTGLFKGAKLDFIPALSPQYVAKEIVNGVREDQHIIFLPHIMRYLIMVKELTPWWIVVLFYQMSGALQWMQNFTGRPATNGAAPPTGAPPPNGAPPSNGAAPPNGAIQEV